MWNYVTWKVIEKSQPFINNLLANINQSLPIRHALVNLNV